MNATEVAGYFRKVEGLPRHASTHAAGVDHLGEPLVDHVPLQKTNGTWLPSSQ